MSTVYLSDSDGGKLVRLASEYGYDNIVQLLLEANFNVNASDKDGCTLLMHACEQGSLDIVQLIVQGGADVNAIDGYGCTPLMRACEKGNLYIVKLLIHAGADVNRSDLFTKNTPLMIACEHGKLDIAQLLINAEANVDVNDAYGQTPLMRACKHGYLDIVQLLVDAGADVNVSDRDGHTPLMIACEHGKPDVARLLVDAGTDVNVSDRDGHTTLMIACEHGQLDIAQLLVDAGADVNVSDTNGHTPLMIACKQGHLDIAQLLINAGANVNVDAYGQTPLKHACKQGHLDIARLLVDAGANMNVDDAFGQTPLMIACEHGHLDIARLLVDAGANVNVDDVYGQTPLMHACKHGYVDIVRLLVDAGTNVSVSDRYRYRQTPLMIACEHGKRLREGANVNAGDGSGCTPIMHACIIGNLDIVQVLVDSGADVNAGDGSGCTPIMHACINGNLDIVKFLINAGADVNAVDKNGSTASMVAHKYGNLEIAQLLPDIGNNIIASNGNGEDDVRDIPVAVKSMEKPLVKAFALMVYLTTLQIGKEKPRRDPSVIWKQLKSISVEDFEGIDYLDFWKLILSELSEIPKSLALRHGINLEEALNKNPSQFHPHVGFNILVGVVAFELGDFDNMIEFYNKAIEVAKPIKAAVAALKCESYEEACSSFKTTMFRIINEVKAFYNWANNSKFESSSGTLLETIGFGRYGNLSKLLGNGGNEYQSDNEENDASTCISVLKPGSETRFENSDICHEHENTEANECYEEAMKYYEEAVIQHCVRGPQTQKQLQESLVFDYHCDDEVNNTASPSSSNVSREVEYSIFRNIEMYSLLKKWDLCKGRIETALHEGQVFHWTTQEDVTRYLLLRLSRILDIQGQKKEAQEIQSQELVNYSRCVKLLCSGAPTPFQVACIEESCRILSNKGKWDEVARMLEATIMVCTRVFGVRHPSTWSLMKTATEIFRPRKKTKAEPVSSANVYLDGVKLVANSRRLFLRGYTLGKVPEEAVEGSARAYTDVHSEEWMYLHDIDGLVENGPDCMERIVHHHASTKHPEVVLARTLITIDRIDKSDKVSVILADLLDALKESMSPDLIDGRNLFSDSGSCIFTATCLLLSAVFHLKIAADIVKVCDFLELLVSIDKEHYVNISGLPVFFLSRETLCLTNYDVSVCVIIQNDVTLEKTSNRQAQAHSGGPLCRKFTSEFASSKVDADYKRIFVFCKTDGILDISDLREIVKAYNTKHELCLMSLVNKTRRPLPLPGFLAIDVVPHLTGHDLSTLLSETCMIPLCTVSADTFQQQTPADINLTPNIAVTKHRFLDTWEASAFYMVLVHCLGRQKDLVCEKKDITESSFLLTGPCIGYLQISKSNDAVNLMLSVMGSDDVNSEVIHVIDHVISDCSRDFKIRCFGSKVSTPGDPLEYVRMAGKARGQEGPVMDRNLDCQLLQEENAQLHHLLEESRRQMQALLIKAKVGEVLQKLSPAPEFFEPEECDPGNEQQHELESEARCSLEDVFVPPVVTQDDFSQPNSLSMEYDRGVNSVDGPQRLVQPEKCNQLCQTSSLGTELTREQLFDLGSMQFERDVARRSLLRAQMSRQLLILKRLGLPSENSGSAQTSLPVSPTRRTEDKHGGATTIATNREGSPTRTFQNSGDRSSTSQDKTLLASAALVVKDSSVVIAGPAKNGNTAVPMKEHPASDVGQGTDESPPLLKDQQCYDNLSSACKPPICKDVTSLKAEQREAKRKEEMASGEAHRAQSFNLHSTEAPLHQKIVNEDWPSLPKPPLTGIYSNKQFEPNASESCRTSEKQQNQEETKPEQNGASKTERPTEKTNETESTSDDQKEKGSSDLNKAGGNDTPAEFQGDRRRVEHNECMELMMGADNWESSVSLLGEDEVLASEQLSHPTEFHATSDDQDALSAPSVVVGTTSTDITKHLTMPEDKVCQQSEKLPPKCEEETFDFVDGFPGVGNTDFEHRTDIVVSDGGFYENKEISIAKPEKESSKIYLSTADRSVDLDFDFTDEMFYGHCDSGSKAESRNTNDEQTRPSMELYHKEGINVLASPEDATMASPEDPTMASHEDATMVYQQQGARPKQRNLQEPGGMSQASSSHAHIGQVQSLALLMQDSGNRLANTFPDASDMDESSDEESLDSLDNIHTVAGNGATYMTTTPAFSSLPGVAKGSISGRPSWFPSKRTNSPLSSGRTGDKGSPFHVQSHAPPKTCDGSSNIEEPRVYLSNATSDGESLTDSLTGAAIASPVGTDVSLLKLEETFTKAFNTLESLQQEMPRPSQAISSYDHGKPRYVSLIGAEAPVDPLRRMEKSVATTFIALETWYQERAEEEREMKEREEQRLRDVRARIQREAEKRIAEREARERELADEIVRQSRGRTRRPRADPPIFQQEQSTTDPEEIIVHGEILVHPFQYEYQTQGTSEWPCEHYKRNCHVKFPCCSTFYPCHRCHNESENCENVSCKALNASHLRCLACQNEEEITEDSASCKKCNTKLSEYFCGKCKHFTGLEKSPFHCEPCGICRIYSERSFHCEICNVCMDKRLKDKHKCRKDSGHDACGICLEDAFSGCQILPCSHKVHRECAIEMIRNGIRTCPVCRHPLWIE